MLNKIPRYVACETERMVVMFTVVGREHKKQGLLVCSFLPLPSLLLLFLSLLFSPTSFFFLGEKNPMSFRHVESGVPLRHPSGDVNQQLDIRICSLEGEVWARDLCVRSWAYMVLETLGMNGWLVKETYSKKEMGPGKILMNLKFND